jgi:hypothetical protein
MEKVIFKNSTLHQNNSTKFLEEENSNSESEEIKQSICLNENSVRITFYGASEKTKKDSICCMKACKNILTLNNGDFPDFLENFTNFGATKDYQVMYDRFREMGLRPGFSMAGVPYYFRRFVKGFPKFEENKCRISNIIKIKHFKFINFKSKFVWD